MLASARRELFVCTAAVLLTAWVAPRHPRVATLGDLLLLSSLVVLGQSLARDLVHLLSRRARQAAGGGVAMVSCVCLESAVGLSTVAAGAVLTLFWAPLRVEVPPAAWPSGLALLTLAGFGARDVVVDWHTWRLRRQSDHNAPLGWGKNTSSS